MPWLKARLREIGKTPTELAAHLQVAPPRVYEMISGRRAMQPDEIAPTAVFLGWELGDVMSKLPKEARMVPSGTLDHKHMVPVLDTVETDSAEWDCVLTGETRRYIKSLPTFEGRTDIKCLHIHSNRMSPRFAPGEMVFFEKAPPSQYDYVVIWLINDGKNPVLVAQLLESDDPKKIKYRTFRPDKVKTLDRKQVAEMFRILNYKDLALGT